MICKLPNKLLNKCAKLLQ